MSTPRTAMTVGLLLAAALPLLLQSCATPPAGDAAETAEATPMNIDPADAKSFAAMIDGISDRKVIFIGETHDRYDHHVNQLAVIRALRERGVDVAIGMEQFQRPFQRHLDDFVAGRIDEATLLERTEWNDRWRFDVRLYRDILDYAQREGIPIVALNAATETVRQVSAAGIDSLGTDERALFPPRIALAQGDYRRQLEAVFQMHGHHMPKHRLQRFMEVQYVWDQTMARSAADYLDDNPRTTLVVLAGSGHVLHDDAIPARLRQLHAGQQAVLITETGYLPEGATPDYIFSARDLSPRNDSQLAAARR
jgi:uncharacterized iron-regulated protein